MQHKSRLRKLYIVLPINRRGPVTPAYEQKTEIALVFPSKRRITSIYSINPDFPKDRATAARADSGFRQRYELFIEKLKKDPNYGLVKDNIAELVEKDIDELALSSDAAYAGPIDASRTGDIKPNQFIDYDTIMANVDKYNRNSRS